MELDRNISGFYEYDNFKIAVFDDNNKLTLKIPDDISRKKLNDFYDNILKEKCIIVKEYEDSYNSIYYYINRIYFEDDYEYTIYYKCRITKLDCRDIYEIALNSKEINVFGQSKDFYEEIRKSFIGKDKINYQDFEISEVVNLNNLLLKFEVFNTLPAPMYLKDHIGFDTFISITSKEKMDNDLIINIMVYINNLLSFCANRRVFTLNYYILFDKNNNECGDIFIPNIKEDDYNYNYSNNLFIRANDFKGKYKQIFDLITTHVIDKSFLCINKSNLNERLINVTGYFNHLFRCYANNHTDRYVVTDINVKDKTQLTVKGNPKNISLSSIIEKFIKYVENYIDFAIQVIRKKDKNTVQKPKLDDVVKNVKKMRNLLCHGKYDELDYSYLDYYLCILESIIYTAILKSIGLFKDDIHKILNDLFGYRLFDFNE